MARAPKPRADGPQRLGGKSEAETVVSAPNMAIVRHDTTRQLGLRVPMDHFPTMIIVPANDRHDSQLFTKYEN